MLDVNGCSTEEGANVQTWRSNGTVAQRFRIVHVGSEVYNIINEASGLFVGITGDDLQNCANVAQWAGNGSDAQKWELCLASDGSLMFKNVASGRFLDVYGCGTTRGTNVEIYDGNQTVAQRFFLKPGDWYMYQGVEGDGMRYIEYAEQFEGRAYKWGGRSPAQGFDCAGLVMYCANQVLGTSYDLIYTNAATLYTLCDPISESEAKPGDLVIYRGTYGSGVNYISHVVIFCGNETMYGAGDPIKYAPVTSIRNIYGEPAKYMYARIR